MVFVLPYVLNIQESDAAGEIVADSKTACPESGSPAARIVCLSNKVRQLSEQAKDLRSINNVWQHSLTECKMDLQTVEPEHAGESCEETHVEPRVSGPNIGVTSNPINTKINNQISTKIIANVNNIYYLLDQIVPSSVPERYKLDYIRNNLEIIKDCSTALLSNKGC